MVYPGGGVTIRKVVGIVDKQILRGKPFDFWRQTGMGK